MTTSEAAKRWHISMSQVCGMCAKGIVTGATKSLIDFRWTWTIPEQPKPLKAVRLKEPKQDRRKQPKEFCTNNPEALYKALRKRISDAGYTLRRFAREKAYMCESVMIQKFNGKIAFSLNDAYDFCDLLQIPYADIHIYFPRDGK